MSTTHKWTPLTQPLGGQSNGSLSAMDEQVAHLARQWQDRFLQTVNLDEFNRMPEAVRRVRIEETLDELMASSIDQIPYGQKKQIVLYILNEALGYGPLSNLVKDSSISEIMVNGSNEIYIERDGKLVRESETGFQNEDHLRNIIDRVVSRAGRRVDEASPMVDARLEDGSRINVVIPPLSLDGPLMTVRKFQRNPFSLEQLVQRDSLTSRMATFLEACVKARMNILVSGGTGAGKTTLLNALGGFIGNEERVVTVEDSAELKFHEISGLHVVRMETRPPNMQGKGEVTIRNLVRNALRMRPDRIIVGEVRGAEALDMLQAMNTGHEGSMTTIHANSAEDALRRIETMVMWAEGGDSLPLTAIREQIVSAIDIVVQIVRYPNGRKIAAISEVRELRHEELVLRDLFRFDLFSTDLATGNVSGRFDSTGVQPSKLIRLQAKGMTHLTPKFFQPEFSVPAFQALLDDKDVTEIMINALDDTRIERRKVGIQPANLVFESQAHLLSMINSFIAPLGKRLDEQHPMVDARLPNGHRLNVVIPPVSRTGSPVLTIRKFPEDPLRIEDLLESGSFSQEMMHFLRACVRARLNILISGGTGSGKTTLLNALSSFIVDVESLLANEYHEERIITIEDVAELQLQHDHWIRLEARSADEFGEGRVTIRDLVINALRMRPDRIIVGEVRGAEALDMLQAMNTGHEGSMTTIHANTAQDAFYRLETMAAWAGNELAAHTVRNQIVGALDLIVQVNRLPDGRRRVVQIAEVLKRQWENPTATPIFDWQRHAATDSQQESWRKRRPSVEFLERMKARGFDITEMFGE
ncbi:MAG: CpaF family protein [Caldilineaceae bacterium]